MHRYAGEYKKLNTAQKRAVELIDGPLLVVAGPGTGKTQLLSMRVANILKKTDTNPEQILCLTFTEKAALNMRERLAGLIGTEAHNVIIRTFHGLGAEIIGNYPDYFWQSAKFTPAPEALQVEIIHNILKRLPLSNPLALRFGGNPTLTKDVLGALKHAKEAGLTPKKLTALVNANLEYLEEIEPKLVEALQDRINQKKIDAIAKIINNLPDQSIGNYIKPLQPLSTVIKEDFTRAYQTALEENKSRAISKFKSFWLSKNAGQYGVFEEKKRNVWQKHLAGVYEKYRKQLYKRGYFDYSDMIVEVISQLENNEDLLWQIQERFLYVLIDEFQDTNEAQMRLAHLIADHDLSNGNPNIMAVGDDDQAIFKFQGAHLNNLLNFKNAYPNSKTVVLTQNYRSNQNILDTASRIIDQAEQRLVKLDNKVSKKLTAAAEHKRGEIRHISYPSQEAQFLGLVKSIESKFERKSSVAVIARKHESLRRFASVLNAENVPIRYERSNNTLSHPISKVVISMARLVQALIEGRQDIADEQLCLLIRHPMWGIDAKKLWRLALGANQTGGWIKTAQSDKQSAKIIDWFFKLTSIAASEPLPYVIDVMLGLSSPTNSKFMSPLREYYLEQKLDSQYISGLSAIRILRSFVSEASRGEESTLLGFLNLVEVHQQNQIIIADESVYATAQDAVQLLTVHKAKGMEFDNVFIIDCVDTDWKPTNIGRKPPINLPLKTVGDDWDDYVRMMFVGATRAISNLTFSSYRQSSAGKDSLTSQIILPVFENNTLVENFEPKDAPALLESSLKWPDVDIKDKYLLLESSLSQYSLSVTHLLNFLDVTQGGPQYFFQRNLLRLPTAKTSNLAHGTAMHDALELAQKLTNHGKFQLQKIKDKYINSLKNENLPQVDFKRWSVRGPEIIEHYFLMKENRLYKGSKPEYKAKGLQVDNATIEGTFDRIDFENKELTIIDYKTGRPVINLRSVSKSEGIKAWKHRTQLIFYNLLASFLPELKNYKINTAMIYVEADNHSQMYKPFTVSQEEIEHLRELIKTAWRKIKNLDFPDTSQYQPSLEGILEFEKDLINKKI